MLSLASLSFVVPLVPFQFLDLGPGPVAPLVRYFPFLMSSAGLLAWLSRDRDVLPVASIGNRLVGWQAIVLLLGALCSVRPAFSGAKVAWYMATGVLLWMVASGCLRRRDPILWVIGVMVSASGVVAAVAVIEECWAYHPLGALVFNDKNPLMNQFSGIAKGQAVATIGNPNPLGSYLVLCLPFAVALAKESRSKGRRGLLVLAASLLVGSLYLTHSRGAIVALIVAVALFVYPTRLLRAACVALAAIGLLLWGSSAGIFGSGRLGGSYQEVAAGWSTAHRLKSLEYATDVWNTEPLLGVGTGCYMYHAIPLGSENDTPDNGYLLSLAESGAAGVVLQVVLFGLVMSTLRQATAVSLARQHGGSDDWLLRAFTASVGSFFVTMGTWDALYFPVTRVLFWIVAGTGVAYSRVVASERVDSQASGPVVTV